MKIAVVTDDRLTISPHFGRGRYYLVFSVEDESIIEKEIRPKPVHHATGDHHHTSGDHHHERDHGHDAGESADMRHRGMIEPIEDCRILIVKGMGPRAKASVQEAGIRPCASEVDDAEEAVRAYLGGRRMGEPGCRDV